MFTGIIYYQGIFRGYRGAKRELTVEAPEVTPKIEIGASLAVNGVCLSLSGKEGGSLLFDLSQETLSRTTLGSLQTGQLLNLELPLTLESSLSGHLVTGHVDGRGKVLRILEKKPGKRLTIKFPPALRPYFIPKGPVSVDGVSLTIAALGPASFEVELIPLTLKKSNLERLRPGSDVNLECDIIGKYVYNYLILGKKRG
jgi:riboflavin synthase